MAEKLTPEIRKYLNKQLFKVTAGNNVEKVQYLLEQGADVNAKDVVGNTPLYMPSTTKTTQLLIEKGSNVNTVNSDGLTPLSFHIKIAPSFSKEDVERIHILAQQNYSQLKKENPQAYNEQEKMLQDWVAKDLENRSAVLKDYEQAQKEMYLKN